MVFGIDLQKPRLISLSYACLSSSFPQLLGSMIVIVLSPHFGNNFTPALQAAFEKVVAAVADAMAYKYY